MAFGDSVCLFCCDPLAALAYREISDAHDARDQRQHHDGRGRGCFGSRLVHINKRLMDDFRKSALGSIALELPKERPVEQRM